MREVQAQHRCLHPREGKGSTGRVFLVLKLFLPGVWSEEPPDNPPAGPAHLRIADVWKEPSEGAGDGAADKE